MDGSTTYYNDDLSFTFIFCFGSNNTKQLSERVRTSEKDLCHRTYAAVVNDYTRCFCGYSRKWDNTSPATMIAKHGHRVVGLAVRMTHDEISALDPYEGKGYSYDRFDLDLIVFDYNNIQSQSVKGQAYMKIIDIEVYVPPSIKYRQACCRTQFLYEVFRSHRTQILRIMTKSGMDALSAALHLAEINQISTIMKIDLQGINITLITKPEEKKEMIIRDVKFDSSFEWDIKENCTGEQ